MTGVLVEEPETSLLIRATSAHDAIVSDPATFGPVAEEVAIRARAEGDAEALVVALRAMAWAERLRQNNGRALALLNEAARRAAAMPHRLGEVLVSRAAVQLELGRLRAALADLDRAAPLVPEDHAPELAHKRGVLLSKLGRLDAARESYRSVLRVPQSPVDLRARAANNLALDAAGAGRVREALEHIALAGTLADEVGPALAALVAQNRGLVLVQCGQLADGLRQLDDAVEALTAVGLPLGEAHTESAEALAALRALPEARQSASRAIAELVAHDVPLMAAEAYLARAEITLRMGEYAAAVRDAEAASALFRRHGRRRWVALATVVITESRRRQGTLTASDVDRIRRAADLLADRGLVAGAVTAGLTAGRAALDVGRTAVARRHLTAAFARSRRAPVLVRIQGRLAAALEADARGADRDVVGHCRAGLDELSAHRAALASTELRAMAAGHGIELGLLGLGCLLRAGSPARVLDWAERTRAAAFLPTAPPAADIAAERAELAAIHGELAEARGQADGTLAGLLARQTAVEARIRRVTWHGAARGAGSDGRPLRTPAVEHALGNRTLASFGRFGDTLFAVVLERGSRRLVQLGPWDAVRFESDALHFALRRLSRHGPPRSMSMAAVGARHALARLQAMVIEPLHLDPDAPLVVLPARDTHRLPWSALHAGPVSVAPSATLWASSRERAARRGVGVVAVAGPGLVGAEAEVAAVARAHPAAVVLGPRAGTVTAVLDAVAGSDLVHFACHGQLRADNPTFSALRLGDGPLTVHELDQHGVAPRRVVLAACDSGADVDYDGGALVGFVSALLSRGAAGVVASVVAVDDLEAVALMGVLHRHLAAGASMADALHSARREVDRADPRQFVNWCAFTAYGAG
jgi:tetratricopeptide (TPR) repeat protein